MAHLSWLKKSSLSRLRPFENFPLFWMSSPQTVSGLFSFAKCMPCEVTPSIRAYREGLGTTIIFDVSYRSGPSHCPQRAWFFSLLCYHMLSCVLCPFVLQYFNEEIFKVSITWKVLMITEKLKYKYRFLERKQYRSIWFFFKYKDYKNKKSKISISGHFLILF